MAIDGWVPKSGGTFEGPVTFDALSTFVAGAKFNDNVDLSGFSIKNVGYPVDDADAINKAYLNFVIESYPASEITNEDIERWDSSSI